MIPLVRVKPVAKDEILESHDWYERRSEGLGERFMASVEETFLRIRKNPGIYLVVHDEMRRAPVAHFSYGVFYSVEQDTIVVHGVLHDRRSPKRWPS
ncbi:MAG TPA: type II toxin-antitoxin system RelE/ParE family toxin [Pirellulales bacterium]|nr:type II toxin-antitoxin system RelE/ParE family toxin [Pirellulales bacterium]